MSELESKSIIPRVLVCVNTCGVDPEDMPYWYTYVRTGVVLCPFYNAQNGASISLLYVFMSWE
jgi:hypothetical protein